MSRAAQSSWQHWKRSKKGQAALKDLDPDEVQDFRRSWLLRKADSVNKVEEVSQEKLSQQLAVKTGWYTKDQNMARFLQHNSGDTRGFKGTIIT